MSSDPNDVSGWSMTFDEDVDLPGWVFLPRELSRADREVWLSEMTAALITLITEAPGGPVASPDPDAVREILVTGLDARATSSSAVLYLVWPVAGVAAVFCHVDLVLAADIPDLSQLDGRLHVADARNIGPGLQFSTRGVVEEGGERVDVSAVHLVFTDAQHGVMIALEESSSALVSQSLVAFGMFKNALVVTRGDGTRFTSVPPGTKVLDDPWPLSTTEEVS